MFRLDRFVALANEAVSVGKRDEVGELVFPVGHFT